MEPKSYSLSALIYLTIADQIPQSNEHSTRWKKRRKEAKRWQSCGRWEKRWRNRKLKREEVIWLCFICLFYLFFLVFFFVSFLTGFDAYSLYLKCIILLLEFLIDIPFVNRTNVGYLCKVWSKSKGRCHSGLTVSLAFRWLAGTWLATLLRS